MLATVNDGGEQLSQSVPRFADWYVLVLEDRKMVEIGDRGCLTSALCGYGIRVRLGGEVVLTDAKLAEH